LDYKSFPWCSLFQ